MPNSEDQCLANADRILNIAVVGGGVIGISTVRELVRYFEELNCGVVNIDLYTDNLGTSACTTSYGAGGLFRIPSEASERINRSTHLRKIWIASFDYFNSICSMSRVAAAKEYGVFRAPAYYLTRDPNESINDRLWGDLAAQFYPDYKIIDEASLHAQGNKIALPSFSKGVFHSPLIVDTAIYMKRLLIELDGYVKPVAITGDGSCTDRRTSVSLTINDGMHVECLDALSRLRQAVRSEDCANGSFYKIVINCTGLGSYHLIGDRSMFPVRGHMTRVNAPMTSEASCYETVEDYALMMFADGAKQTDGAKSSNQAVAADDPSSKAEYYIIPQVRCRIACGGIRQANSWSLQVEPEHQKQIMELCRRNYKNGYFDWGAAEILEDWVGLRPFRKEGERIEYEWCDLLRSFPVSDDGTSAVISGQKQRTCVIHNYGHGASGICLSYGSAKRVIELVSEVLSCTV